MSNPQQIANEKRGASDIFGAEVENAALQIVLGALTGLDTFALLRGLCEQAIVCDRGDIAQLIDSAIESASKATDPAVADSLVSDCITRVQHVLCNPIIAPAGSPASLGTSLTASPSVPLGEDRELLGDFILESRDHLTQVELQIMTLEKNPAEDEAVNTVFRAFHTIKGLAGFLGLDDIRDVAHETETLLDLARNHKLIISPGTVDVVLASADFLKACLLSVEQRLSGSEISLLPDKSLLTARIRSAASSAIETPVRLNPEQASVGVHTTDTASPEWTAQERRNGEDRRGRPSDSNCVKVGTAKLDLLVEMAGELVIAESMVRHHPELAQLHSPAVLNSLAQMARITTELQKTAMSMRMVPIGGLFQKMNRLIRDLGRKTGKRVELECIGSETELDRNVVEELADPLMHMIRNAVDHGLESEEERLAAGKDPIGHVLLRAGHHAGHVVIEIGDDGRGLDRDRILTKARQMCLLDGSGAVNETEIFDLIFHPGFSTAAQITDVSGRGVGMDVVKKRIQNLRGRVEIRSTAGRGTTFYLRLPLTLAIIDGLVVGVGSERYVVPIFSVREMLRPTADMIFTVEGLREMALVRNNLLPVVRLYKRFGIQPRSREASDSLLIVAEAAGRAFCLMVDDLIGKQEVVIKSLGEIIKDIPGVAGGAILGDGRVGLILDLEGVFQGESK
jgi:two-component system, chemotaxis family, sensor kinase CheA